MTSTQRILLFFVLPTLAPLIFPLDWVTWLVSDPAGGISVTGLVLVGLAVGLLISLGFLLQRGHSAALTLSIFLQGLNVIIRLMMFFPRVTYTDGTLNPMYMLTSIISIALSMYLLLRLDKVDVRTTMVR